MYLLIHYLLELKDWRWIVWVLFCHVVGAQSGEEGLIQHFALLCVVSDLCWLSSWSLGLQGWDTCLPSVCGWPRYELTCCPDALLISILEPFLLVLSFGAFYELSVVITQSAIALMCWVAALCPVSIGGATRLAHLSLGLFELIQPPVFGIGGGFSNWDYC